MGTDRFVNWDKLKPTRDEVKHVLEDYLGGLEVEITYGTHANGVSNSEDMEFWAVRLSGKPTFPFRRIEEFKNDGRMSEYHKERWFEVVVTDDYIDVITRLGDEMTSVIANGFADLCARFWQTKVEK